MLIIWIVRQNLGYYLLTLLQSLKLERLKHCPELVVERSTLGTLDLPLNRAWVFTLDTLNVVFPPAYNFAACLEEVRDTIVWK